MITLWHNKHYWGTKAYPVELRIENRSRATTFRTSINTTPSGLEAKEGNQKEERERDRGREREGEKERERERERERDRDRATEAAATSGDAAAAAAVAAAALG